jgi:hypothetical protein
LIGFAAVMGGFGFINEIGIFAKLIRFSVLSLRLRVKILKEESIFSHCQVKKINVQTHLGFAKGF